MVVVLSLLLGSRSSFTHPLSLWPLPQPPHPPVPDSVECLDALIQSRQRKCPTCGIAFGQADVKEIFL
jgi:hypothetical protein